MVDVARAPASQSGLDRQLADAVDVLVDNDIDRPCDIDQVSANGLNYQKATKVLVRLYIICSGAATVWALENLLLLHCILLCSHPLLVPVNILFQANSTIHRHPRQPCGLRQKPETFLN